jgi:hypothetical protein
MTDRTRLEGQVAFVKGGGGDIGRGIALRLAEAIAPGRLIPPLGNSTAPKKWTR